MSKCQIDANPSYDKRNFMTAKKTVIAIDGPSGSGKSTLAKRLAEALGVLYIDTGAMFRALGLEMHELGLSYNEGPQLNEFLNSLSLIYGRGGETYLEINQKNVTERIREHHVSKLASQVSKLPSVRRYLLQFQRELAHGQVCVMEGRDIGTVVFPDAFTKFFISASVEERAKRRWEQLKAQNSQGATLELAQVLVDVQKRDESDMGREEAPLIQAEDAHYIDTSSMDLSEVLARVVEMVKVDAQKAGVSLP
jgi:CMP/dCMP kinase